ncbi:hypothetical protein [Roseiconus lacunae]|uniref:hypothetical protein n=1 Tax=Roseiconus lacunae TaxID=2605694 RepID=UPI001E4B4C9D|nr:hypothetical protein [Roseiconus lacunae]MCD0463095.1 hypothetical protein [Roseiconus lacunae]
MKSQIIVSLAVASFLLFASRVDAGIINFDDGTLGVAVESFYSAQGVEFQNTSWRDSLNYPGTSGALVIGATNNGGLSNIYAYQKADAVIAKFQLGASSISIDAVDVGDNGFRIDAYDSLTGGTLVDFDEVLGTGFGAGSVDKLSVSATLIRRVEMYQLAAVSVDGVLVDNLEFSSSVNQVVPEPEILSYWSAGLLGLLVRRRRHEKSVA